MGQLALPLCSISVPLPPQLVLALERGLSVARGGERGGTRVDCRLFSWCDYLALSLPVSLVERPPALRSQHRLRGPREAVDASVGVGAAVAVAVRGCQRRLPEMGCFFWLSSHDNAQASHVSHFNSIKSLCYLTTRPAIFTVCCISHTKNIMRLVVYLLWSLVVRLQHLVVRLQRTNESVLLLDTRP